MKLSKYTLFVDDFPKQGQYIAFNTRTQAQVVIDDRLRNVLALLPVAGDNPEVLSALDTLLSMGIVTIEETDEEELLARRFAEIKNDTSNMSVTVLTTYDCNFGCPYCVEEGVKVGIYMDEETARKTIDYVAGRMERQKPKSLSLRFYGGEPLMNVAAIRSVAAGLKQRAEGRGVKFGFSVTTNGALLVPKVVDELLPVGLKAARITLDGTREFHDRKRPFRNGKGSFDIILANIQSAVERIKIFVGGNFDQENVEGAYQLIDQLADMGLDSKLASLGFKPIFPNMQDRIRFGATADMGCVFAEKDVMEHLVALRRHVMERGFTADPVVGINLCSMVMDGSSIVIDPLGKLYRCPSFVGFEDYAEGDINAPGQERFTRQELWRRCADCAYAPLCGDGCLYAAFIRYGDYTKLNCQKEFMKYMVEENLKLDYLDSHR